LGWYFCQKYFDLSFCYSGYGYWGYVLVAWVQIRAFEALLGVVLPQTNVYHLADFVHFLVLAFVGLDHAHAVVCRAVG
jgi:hypothetical protein